MHLAARKKVILIVDDDTVLLGILSRNAERGGLEIVTARHGAEAVAVLTSITVDAVVTDIKMPGGDGHGLIRWLRSERPGLPIAVMSGANDVDDVIAAFRAGIVDYLKKPFHPAEFLDLVQRMLDGRPTGAPAPAAGVDGVDGEAVREIVRNMDLSGEALPAPDPLASKIVEMQAQTGLSGEHVVRLLERSQSISSRVITLASSAYYRGQRNVTNLKEAVVRLGNRTVLNTALTMLHRGFYQVGNESYAALLTGLWAPTVFVATLARELARRGVGGDPEDVFLAALFHRVGEGVILRQAAAAGGQPDVRVLARACADHHERVGEAVLGAWKFPARCARIARVHQSLAHSSGRPALLPLEEQIVHLLAIGTAVAGERGLASPVSAPPELDVEQSMAAVGLSPKALEIQIGRTVQLLGDEAR